MSIRMMHARRSCWLRIAGSLLVLLVLGAIVYSAAASLCDQGARIAVIDTK